MTREVKKPVRTPGGRVGDDATHGSRRNGTNWIERTPQGKLPKYIRIIRNGLMRQGHSEGSATRLAIGAVRRWARGGDNVSPKVRAAAAAAVAEYEAMRKGPKKKEHTTSTPEVVHTGEDQTGADAAKSSGDNMKMEHKTVGISGFKVLDEPEGIVEAFVSVTGLKDNVNDIIEPGAYEKTLASRTPKGVWSHDWNTPVSKTLGIKELLPGDPELPKTLPNGDPWPAEAGALKVTTQFNLKTQRGRDAYEDVQFFGDDQEWSIGYNVPAGGAVMNQKTATRHIKNLDLFEYSPVLFGAMPNARSMSQGVKAAQEAHMAYKTLFGDDYYVTMDKKALDEFVMEAKTLLHDESAPVTEDHEEKSDESLDGIDLPDDFIALAEKGVLSADNIHLVQKAAAALGDLLDALGMAPESKKSPVIDTEESKTLRDVLDAAESVLDEKTIEELSEHVDGFDAAVEGKDDEGAEEHANAVLDLIDEKIDNVSDDEGDGLKAIADALASILTKMADEDEDDPEDDESKNVSEEGQEKKTAEAEADEIIDLSEFSDMKSFLTDLG